MPVRPDVAAKLAPASLAPVDEALNLLADAVTS